MTYKTKPVKKRIMPNDVVSKRVFDMGNDFQRNLESTRRIEFQVAEKIQNATSTVIIKITDGYTGDIKLTKFDQAVFCACLSAQIIGNDAISLNQIYRYLGGSETHSTPAEIEDLIEDSLEKLMGLKIRVDCSAVARVSNYKFGRVTKFTDVILPGRYEESEFNGQTTKTFIFHNKSPLFEVAEIKGQILRIPQGVYAIEKMHLSESAVSLKEYIVQRVMECQKHPNITNRILFKEIYRVCGLESATKRQRQSARKNITKILGSLIESKIIEKYSFEKAGNYYDAIEFSIAVQEPTTTKNQPLRNKLEN